jgi:hypothetical protein
MLEWTICTQTTPAGSQYRLYKRFQMLIVFAVYCMVIDMTI